MFFLLVLPSDMFTPFDVHSALVHTYRFDSFVHSLLPSLCFSPVGAALTLLPHRLAVWTRWRFNVQSPRMTWYSFIQSKCVERGNSHHSAAQTPSTSDSLNFPMPVQTAVLLCLCQVKSK